MSSDAESAGDRFDDLADELAGVLGRAARGDEGAWRRLIELFGRRVFALVKSRGVSGDMAEEITQSVFATVAAKLPGGGYLEQGKFEAWIFRIAMNRVRDEGRRRARHHSVGGAGGPGGVGGVSLDSCALGDLADKASGGQASAGDQLRAKERREHQERELERLRQAMDELTDADREVVQLRHHGGLSFKQIALMLNEPLGTLLARHHRALKKLALLLAGSSAGGLSGGAEEAIS